MSAPLVQACGATRRFGERIAVEGLDLSVARGELFGVVGPDGSGKSTALRMLAGILSPTAGTVHYAGRTLAGERPHVGYVPQRFGQYGDLSVRENLAFQADLYEVPAADRAARIGRLMDFSGLAPFLDVRADGLSGGMRQKLALACALVHAPDLLVLDEPTNGVDPLSRRELWRILAEVLAGGVTVIVSTAYLDEAERCHRLALMRGGRVMALDTPRGVRAAAPGRWCAIEVERAWRVRDLAAVQPGVWTAHLAGHALHLAVADPVETPRAVCAALTAAGAPPESCRPVKPTFEDVYVSLVEREEARR